MRSDIEAAKALLTPFFDALQHGAVSDGHAALKKVADDAQFRMCHPFGDLDGASAYVDAVLNRLEHACLDLERIEYIRIAGVDHDGAIWVGSGGQYQGRFDAPWLDIPVAGRFASMRFHEFYRIEDGRVAEMQAIWDIPELMMQAGVWPMAPQLGRFRPAPAPMSNDGLGPHDPAQSEASKTHVIDMLTAMVRHPSQGGPEVMELDRYWHPSFMWYGPCGIGTARGAEEFRRFHQIPFLNAMPDRGQHEDRITHHFMGEGDYVGVTGWPNMCQTISAPGWLGLPPLNKQITLRSLDFWRIEDGKIRENWVLVDLLDMYAQIGVDVFARMREVAWSKGYR